MSQRIVFERPPIFDDARAKFGPRVDRAIFSWGDIIYNPSRIYVTPALVEHEAVHGARQRPDIAGWWRRYLDDAEFRLGEEIPAHQAEYRHLNQHGNRNDRRAAAKLIASRLASPLYGRLITAPAAEALLKEAA